MSKTKNELIEEQTKNILTKKLGTTKLVNIKVKTQKTPRIEYEKQTQTFLVQVKSAKENNEANQEIIRLIKKTTGKNVKISRGTKNNKKTLKIIE